MTSQFENTFTYQKLVLIEHFCSRFTTNSLLPEIWSKHYSMNTSSSICHRFDVEIPRGKFVEISLIFKDESAWKLWRRFSVKISTWIRLWKSTKYWWVLRMDFSMSYRRQIEVISVLPVSIVSCPNIFCGVNLF